jgi:hypothetical protein
MTLTLGILGGLVALMAVFVIALCKAAARADLEQPLYPQRLELVKRAQREIAEQARWARER